MCTLAILPAEGGYLLGHNRDESRLRSRGLPPSRASSAGTAFLAPRDPDGGGSWIAASETGITFCLLNAAHLDPARLPERPPSRGRILDHVARLTRPEEVASALRGGSPSLDEMRGFHLVMTLPPAPGHAARAARFRWDGRTLDLDEHPVPSLFVSSGYDQAGAEAARGAVWRRRLAESGPAGRGDLEALLASHEPERGVLSICMHGEHAATVSRTIVRVGSRQILVWYRDGAPCDAGATEHASGIARR